MKSGSDKLKEQSRGGKQHLFESKLILLSSAAAETLRFSMEHIWKLSENRLALLAGPSDELAFEPGGRPGEGSTSRCWLPSEFQSGPLVPDMLSNYHADTENLPNSPQQPEPQADQRTMVFEQIVECNGYDEFEDEEEEDEEDEYIEVEMPKTTLPQQQRFRHPQQSTSYQNQPPVRVQTQRQYVQPPRQYIQTQQQQIRQYPPVQRQIYQQMPTVVQQNYEYYQAPPQSQALSLPHVTSVVKDRRNQKSQKIIMVDPFSTACDANVNWKPQDNYGNYQTQPEYDRDELILIMDHQLALVDVYREIYLMTDWVKLKKIHFVPDLNTKSLVKDTIDMPLCPAEHLPLGATPRDAVLLYNKEFEYLNWLLVPKNTYVPARDHMKCSSQIPDKIIRHFFKTNHHAIRGFFRQVHTKDGRDPMFMGDVVYGLLFPMYKPFRDWTTAQKVSYIKITNYLVNMQNTVEYLSNKVKQQVKPGPKKKNPDPIQEVPQRPPSIFEFLESSISQSRLETSKEMQRLYENKDHYSRCHPTLRLDILEESGYDITHIYHSNANATGPMSACQSTLSGTLVVHHKGKPPVREQEIIIEECEIDLNDPIYVDERVDCEARILAETLGPGASQSYKERAQLSRSQAYAQTSKTGDNEREKSIESVHELVEANIEEIMGEKSQAQPQRRLKEGASNLPVWKYMKKHNIDAEAYLQKMETAQPSKPIANNRRGHKFLKKTEEKKEIKEIVEVEAIVTAEKNKKREQKKKKEKVVEILVTSRPVKLRRPKKAKKAKRRGRREGPGRPKKYIGCKAREKQRLDDMKKAEEEKLKNAYMPVLDQMMQGITGNMNFWLGIGPANLENENEEVDNSGFVTSTDNSFIENTSASDQDHDQSREQFENSAETPAKAPEALEKKQSPARPPARGRSRGGRSRQRDNAKEEDKQENLYKDLKNWPVPEDDEQTKEALDRIQMATKSTGMTITTEDGEKKKMPVATWIEDDLDLSDLQEIASLLRETILSVAVNPPVEPREIKKRNRHKYDFPPLRHSERISRKPKATVSPLRNDKRQSERLAKTVEVVQDEHQKIPQSSEIENAAEKQAVLECLGALVEQVCEIQLNENVVSEVVQKVVVPEAIIEVIKLSLNEELPYMKFVKAVKTRKSPRNRKEVVPKTVKKVRGKNAVTVEKVHTLTKATELRTIPLKPVGEKRSILALVTRTVFHVAGDENLEEEYDEDDEWSASRNVSVDFTVIKPAERSDARVQVQKNFERFEVESTIRVKNVTEKPQKEAEPIVAGQLNETLDTANSSASWSCIVIPGAPLDVSNFWSDFSSPNKTVNVETDEEELLNAFSAKNFETSTPMKKPDAVEESPLKPETPSHKVAISFTEADRKIIGFKSEEPKSETSAFLMTKAKQAGWDMEEAGEVLRGVGKYDKEILGSLVVIWNLLWLSYGKVHNFFVEPPFLRAVSKAVAIWSIERCNGTADPKVITKMESMLQKKISTIKRPQPSLSTVVPLNEKDLNEIKALLDKNSEVKKSSKWYFSPLEIPGDAEMVEEETVETLLETRTIHSEEVTAPQLLSTKSLQSIEVTVELTSARDQECSLSINEENREEASLTYGPVTSYSVKDPNAQQNASKQCQGASLNIEESNDDKAFLCVSTLPRLVQTTKKSRKEGVTVSVQERHEDTVFSTIGTTATHRVKICDSQKWRKAKKQGVSLSIEKSLKEEAFSTVSPMLRVKASTSQKDRENSGVSLSVQENHTETVFSTIGTTATHRVKTSQKEKKNRSVSLSIDDRLEEKAFSTVAPTSSLYVEASTSQKGRGNSGVDLSVQDQHTETVFSTIGGTATHRVKNTPKPKTRKGVTLTVHDQNEGDASLTIGPPTSCVIADTSKSDSWKGVALTLDDQNEEDASINIGPPKSCVIADKRKPDARKGVTLTLRDQNEGDASINIGPPKSCVIADESKPDARKGVSLTLHHQNEEDAILSVRTPKAYVIADQNMKQEGVTLTLDDQNEKSATLNVAPTSSCRIKDARKQGAVQKTRLTIEDRNEGNTALHLGKRESRIIDGAENEVARIVVLDLSSVKNNAAVSKISRSSNESRVVGPNKLPETVLVRISKSVPSSALELFDDLSKDFGKDEQFEPSVKSTAAKNDESKTHGEFEREQRTEASKTSPEDLWETFFTKTASSSVPENCEFSAKPAEIKKEKYNSVCAFEDSRSRKRGIYEGAAETAEEKRKRQAFSESVALPYAESDFDTISGSLTSNSSSVPTTSKWNYVDEAETSFKKDHCVPKDRAGSNENGDTQDRYISDEVKAIVDDAMKRSSNEQDLDAIIRKLKLPDSAGRKSVENVEKDDNSGLLKENKRERNAPEKPKDDDVLIPFEGRGKDDDDDSDQDDDNENGRPKPPRGAPGVSCRPAEIPVLVDDVWGGPIYPENNGNATGENMSSNTTQIEPQNEGTGASSNTVQVEQIQPQNVSPAEGPGSSRPQFFYEHINVYPGKDNFCTQIPNRRAVEKKFLPPIDSILKQALPYYPDTPGLPSYRNTMTPADEEVVTNRNTLSNPMNSTMVSPASHATQSASYVSPASNTSAAINNSPRSLPQPSFAPSPMPPVGYTSNQYSSPQTPQSGRNSSLSSNRKRMGEVEEAYQKRSRRSDLGFYPHRQQDMTPMQPTNATHSPSGAMPIPPSYLHQPFDNGFQGFTVSQNQLRAQQTAANFAAQERNGQQQIHHLQHSPQLQMPQRSFGNGYPIQNPYQPNAFNQNAVGNGVWQEQNHQPSNPLHDGRLGQHHPGMNFPQQFEARANSVGPAFPAIHHTPPIPQDYGSWSQNHQILQAQPLVQTPHQHHPVYPHHPYPFPNNYYGYPPFAPQQANQGAHGQRALHPGISPTGQMPPNRYASQNLMRLSNEVMPAKTRDLEERKKAAEKRKKELNAFGCRPAFVGAPNNRNPDDDDDQQDFMPPMPHSSNGNFPSSSNGMLGGHRGSLSVSTQEYPGSSNNRSIKQAEAVSPTLLVRTLELEESQYVLLEATSGSSKVAELVEEVLSSSPLSVDILASKSPFSPGLVSPGSSPGIKVMLPLPPRVRSSREKGATVATFSKKNGCLSFDALFNVSRPKVEASAMLSFQISEVFQVHADIPAPRIRYRKKMPIVPRRLSDGNEMSTSMDVREVAVRRFDVMDEVPFDRDAPCCSYSYHEKQPWVAISEKMPFELREDLLSLLPAKSSRLKILPERVSRIDLKEETRDPRPKLLIVPDTRPIEERYRSRSLEIKNRLPERFYRTSSATNFSDIEQHITKKAKTSMKAVGLNLEQMDDSVARLSEEEYLENVLDGHKLVDCNSLIHDAAKNRILESMLSNPESRTTIGKGPKFPSEQQQLDAAAYKKHLEVFDRYCLLKSVDELEVEESAAEGDVASDSVAPDMNGWETFQQFYDSNMDLINTYGAQIGTMQEDQEMYLYVDVIQALFYNHKVRKLLWIHMLTRLQRVLFNPHFVSTWAERSEDSTYQEVFLEKLIKLRRDVYNAIDSTFNIDRVRRRIEEWRELESTNRSERALYDQIMFETVNLIQSIDIPAYMRTRTYSWMTDMQMNRNAISIDHADIELTSFQPSVQELWILSSALEEAKIPCEDLSELFNVYTKCTRMPQDMLYRAFFNQGYELGNAFRSLGLRDGGLVDDQALRYYEHWYIVNALRNWQLGGVHHRRVMIRGVPAAVQGLLISSFAHREKLPAVEQLLAEVDHYYCSITKELRVRKLAPPPIPFITAIDIFEDSISIATIVDLQAVANSSPLPLEPAVDSATRHRGYRGDIPFDVEVDYVNDKVTVKFFSDDGTKSGPSVCFTHPRNLPQIDGVADWKAIDELINTRMDKVLFRRLRYSASIRTFAGVRKRKHDEEEPEAEAEERFCIPAMQRYEERLRRTWRRHSLLTSKNLAVHVEKTSHEENLVMTKNQAAYAERERKKMFRGNDARDIVTVNRINRQFLPVPLRRTRSAQNWFGRTHHEHFLGCWAIAEAKLVGEAQNKMPSRPWLHVEDDAETIVGRSEPTSPLSTAEMNSRSEPPAKRVCYVRDDIVTPEYLLREFGGSIHKQRVEPGCEWVAEEVDLEELNNRNSQIIERHYEEVLDDDEEEEQIRAGRLRTTSP
ncbi:unnamed protein product [Caenorhabditis auriculariae]|uniref:Uncharacterized protein n=1 Tax=Caenorhabditis auriculariae TaxID=2777116 RepID=A0A8S1GZP4_9PELO|nr:unnamed protein product [Caenorhabditis auriculariae]